MIINLHETIGAAGQETYQTVYDYEFYEDILFLVEKSLRNINCLIACISTGSKKTSKIDFSEKTFPGVFQCEAFKSDVSFFKQRLSIFGKII